MIGRSGVHTACRNAETPHLRVALGVGGALFRHGHALLVDGTWQVPLLTRAALSNEYAVSGARVDALAVEGHQPCVARAVALGVAVAAGRAHLNAGTVEGFVASLGEGEGFGLACAVLGMMALAQRRQRTLEGHVTSRHAWKWNGRESQCVRESVRQGTSHPACASCRSVVTVCWACVDGGTAVAIWFVSSLG